MRCLTIFSIKCSIFCWACGYILIVNLKVQLYCIVTGSCRLFHRSSRLMYTYSGVGRELFVAILLQWLLSYFCLRYVSAIYVCVFSRHSNKRRLSVTCSLKTAPNLHTMFRQVNNIIILMLYVWHCMYLLFIYIMFIFSYLFISRHDTTAI